RLSTVPGVTAAAAVRPLPLASGSFGGERISLRPAGAPEPPPAEQILADLRFVTPGSFRALGIPLLQGRDFGPQDRRDAPSVAVLNETLAKRLWPDGQALGRRIALGRGEALVVGIAGDVRQTRLDAEPAAAIYTAHSQSTRRGMSLVVRTQGRPLDLLG